MDSALTSTESTMRGSQIRYAVIFCDNFPNWCTFQYYFYYRETS